MVLQTDLNLFKEKAAAVQVMVSEIMDLQAAFAYAADLTKRQGGRVMAAFGWDGQDQAALEEACRGAGVHLVADNLREHAADLLVTDCPGCVLQLKGGMDKRGSQVKVKHIAELVAAAQIEPDQP